MHGMVLRCYRSYGCLISPIKWNQNSCKLYHYVHTTLWMHLMHTNKTHSEQTQRELQENDEGCLEQILKAAPSKTVAVRPLASHHTNHPRKTNKICRALLEKIWQTESDVFWWSPAHECASVYRSTKNYLHSALCGHKMITRRPTTSDK